MKHHKTILFFLITISISIQAQHRGNRQNYSQGQGQGQMQGQMQTSEINEEFISERMANLIQYDTDEVLKKLKVKSDEQKATVTKALSKYNSKINELKIFNSTTFNEVKLYLNKKRDEAMLSNNNFAMKEAKIQADEMLNPIKQKVQEQQIILNEAIEKELSEKQYKNWLNYQQKTVNLESSNLNQNSPMQNNTKQKGKKQKGY